MSEFKTKEELEREIAELSGLKYIIESDLFQSKIVAVLDRERKKIRTCFFSDSLKDSWRKGGKKEGIDLFFKILKDIHIELKDLYIELENYS